MSIITWAAEKAVGTAIGGPVGFLATIPRWIYEVIGALLLVGGVYWWIDSRAYDRGLAHDAAQVAAWQANRNGWHDYAIATKANLDRANTDRLASERRDIATIKAGNDALAVADLIAAGQRDVIARANAIIKRRAPQVGPCLNPAGDALAAHSREKM